MWYTPTISVTKESLMSLSREQMDAAVNEHFGFEAADDLDGVMASLAPEVEHEIVPSPVGVLHDKSSRTARLRASRPGAISRRFSGSSA